MGSSSAWLFGALWTAFVGSSLLMLLHRRALPIETWSRWMRLSEQDTRRFMILVGGTALVGAATMILVAVII